jgi:hypothetical protein
MRPKLFRKPHCGILLQNSILNFKATENYIDEDANESTQTRTFDVGVIEITELTTDQTKIFELNVPIAFWIMGVQHDN